MLAQLKKKGNDTVILYTAVSEKSDILNILPQSQYQMIMKMILISAD
jgi:hypothetical protein